MSPTFLDYEEQRRLRQQSDDLHEEIRGQTLKAMAIIDRLLIILDEHQDRRERERIAQNLMIVPHILVRQRVEQTISLC